eukprot:6202952-Pleurochrysis_carterae.AAC.1
MAVSCRESCSTALVIAQGVTKIGDESPRKTPLAAHGYAHRTFPSGFSLRPASRRRGERIERLYDSRSNARSLSRLPFTPTPNVTSLGQALRLSFSIASAAAHCRELV